MSRSDYTVEVENVHEVDAIQHRPVMANAKPPSGAGRNIRVLLTNGGWQQQGNHWYDGSTRVSWPVRDAIVMQLRRNLEAQGEIVDERALETEADTALAGTASL